MISMVQPSSARVGYIGLGVMGLAMARNIMKAGFQVSVHNRSPGKVAEIIAEGAKDGRSPAGIAQECDIVFLCLPDTSDVELVLFGTDGITSTARPGLVVIDTSTISPTATMDFAERLKASGMEMIDSPVSGGPAGALAGSLVCMLGGEAQVIEACMPILSAIGKTHVHLGKNGSGQMVKACNQLVIGATLAGVSEAIAMCRKSGIDGHKMREALLGGSAQSKVLENHGKRILDGAFEPGFRSSLMLKDLKIAAAAARDVGVFAPAAALVTELFTALCNSGSDGLDASVLGSFISELSAVPRV